VVESNDRNHGKSDPTDSLADLQLLHRHHDLFDLFILSKLLRVKP
jgi:hypothetical protein